MRHVGGKGVGCDIFPKAFKVHLLQVYLVSFWNVREYTYISSG